MSAAVVDADGDAVVRLDFEANARAFPVVFRWVAPDGRPRFSSPVFVVPPGSGTAAWIHERRGVLSPGR